MNDPVLKNLKKFLFISLFLSISFFTFCQTDIAQWRGPQRNGKYPDKNLRSIWPENGLPVVLKIEGIGNGFSSAVVYKNTIYTSGKKDTMDVVCAFDVKGKRLWEKAYGKAWTKTYPENRNTPSLEGNKIFVSSGIGEVVCLDARNGDILWKRYPHEEFKGKFSYWGPAESYVLTDNAVICTVGGDETSVVALDKNTGKLIWKSPSIGDAMAYASPLLIERNGNKIILVELERDLLGINPLNGEIFWTFNLRPEADSLLNWLNHINTPLYKDGEIFVTRGYDFDAVMLSLSEDGHSVKLKWKNKALDTHTGGVVEVNGYIYGSTWITNTKGNWACLDWNTGKLMYDQEWFNKGSVIYADGHLYCMDEKRGNLALVLPDPSGFKVVSTFRVEAGNGMYWAHPAIFNGNLYVRHGDVLMVYSLKK